MKAINWYNPFAKLNNLVHLNIFSVKQNTGDISKKKINYHQELFPFDTISSFYQILLYISVVYKDNMYVFGGYSGRHDLHFRDVFKFDPGNDITS